MNDKELHSKVHTTMYNLIKEKGIASPVDVLIAVGVLSKTDYERWRNGEIDYLERVCKINLRKLSKINHEIRAFANKNDLKPSWTLYKRWGKNKKGNKGSKGSTHKGDTAKLRFSKSGDKNIEKQYATHYISQRTVADAKERRRMKDTQLDISPHLSDESGEQTQQE